MPLLYLCTLTLLVTCAALDIFLIPRSGEEEKKIDHTGEPNKKRGKVQKKSMLSFDEDEEDEEYR